jgi:hypothetical protein
VFGDECGAEYVGLLQKAKLLHGLQLHATGPNFHSASFYLLFKSTNLILKVIYHGLKDLGMLAIVVRA